MRDIGDSARLSAAEAARLRLALRKFREMTEGVARGAIEVLDALDGDPDLEPDADAEPDDLPVEEFLACPACRHCG